MFAWLRRRQLPDLPSPAVPAGERVYAIGDVHGRIDLLDQLLARIADDEVARGPADTAIILLGDLIDRGPESAAVIERICERIEAGLPIRVLMGNHEEVLVAALAGDAEALRRSLRIGGLSTLASYGLTLERLEQEITDEDGVALLRRFVPGHHQTFLAGMEQGPVRIGDYLFVHAGIRPDIPLDEQAGEDLRWIRKPFLSHRQSFGPMIVHGHSIRTRPDLRANRLGIDTGAYRTGRLTALGLQGTDRWILQTEPTAADEAAGACKD